VNVVAGAASGINSKIKPSGSSSRTRASWTDTFGLVIDARDARGNAVTDPTVALKTTVTATLEPLEGFETVETDVATRRVDGSFRSGFIPRVPGTYSVTATFPGGTVTSPHVVHVYLAPAPRLVRATMADSLGSIDVRFDAATDRALSGGEGSCAGLLSDETVRILGTGARCAWSNDFVLTLYTGKDPIAMPRTALSVADKIELRPGVVRAKLGASRAAFGAAEIEPPLNPLTVDAHLVGPTTIGACDPALFTASSSTGAGGRPMRYRFGVTSEHDAGKILERIFRRI